MGPFHNLSSTETIVDRPYRDEADLVRIRAMLMEARAQTNDWYCWHVGLLAFNFFMLDCHLDPREHIRLWEVGGRLVAFAILEEDPTFDCQVRPEYLGFGIETRALAWVNLRIAELRKQDEARWSGELASGAHQNDTIRLNFLAENGFHLRGDFSEVNMMRSLEEPIPELDLPQDFTIREVSGVVEAAARADIQRDVWQPWSVGEVSEKDYLRMMRMPGYNRSLDLVVLTPERLIVSYVNGWIDPLNRIGDFGPLGARVPYRRQGLTRLLLLEALRRMKALGMDRVCVSTGVGNIPARCLYESIGFEVENSYLDYVCA